MRNAETELGIIQACLEVVTGERLKIERLTSRSEGGGWKSARQATRWPPTLRHTWFGEEPLEKCHWGNSLAAYSTSRPVP